jgi:hypothetical protein
MEVMTECSQAAVHNLAVKPVLADKPITRGIRKGLFVLSKRFTPHSHGVIYYPA